MPRTRRSTDQRYCFHCGRHVPVENPRHKLSPCMYCHRVVAKGAKAPAPDALTVALPEPPPSNDFEIHEDDLRAAVGATLPRRETPKNGYAVVGLRWCPKRPGFAVLIVDEQIEEKCQGCDRNERCPKEHFHGYQCTDCETIYLGVVRASACCETKEG